MNSLRADDPCIGDGITRHLSCDSQKWRLKLQPWLLQMFILSIQSIQSIFMDTTWSNIGKSLLASSGYVVFSSHKTSQSPEALYQTASWKLKAANIDSLFWDGWKNSLSYRVSYRPLTSEQYAQMLINRITRWNNQLQYTDAADLNRTKSFIFEIGSWNIFTTAWDFIYLAPWGEMKGNT